MPNNQAERINEIASAHPSLAVTPDFFARVKREKLTRDEDPHSHWCVYFAGFDPEAKKLFIGHHMKSGLWLFNGGHIDKGETPEEALEREMGEEWGVKISLQDIGEPKLLTITTIDHPTIQCKQHFDIWYFVPLSEANFSPEQALLSTEYYEIGWKDIEAAKSLITDENTLKAVTELESLFQRKSR